MYGRGIGLCRQDDRLDVGAFATYQKTEDHHGERDDGGDDRDDDKTVRFRSLLNRPSGLLRPARITGLLRPLVHRRPVACVRHRRLIGLLRSAVGNLLRRRRLPNRIARMRRRLLLYGTLLRRLRHGPSGWDVGLRLRRGSRPLFGGRLLRSCRLRFFDRGNGRRRRTLRRRLYCCRRCGHRRGRGSGRSLCGSGLRGLLSGIQVIDAVRIHFQGSDTFYNISAVRGDMLFNFSGKLLDRSLCVARIYAVCRTDQPDQHSVVFFQERNECNGSVVLVKESAELRNDQSLVGFQVVRYNFVDHGLQSLDSIPKNRAFSE